MMYILHRGQGLARQINEEIPPDVKTGFWSAPPSTPGSNGVTWCLKSVSRLKSQRRYPAVPRFRLLGPLLSSRSPSRNPATQRVHVSLAVPECTRWSFVYEFWQLSFTTYHTVGTHDTLFAGKSRTQSQARWPYSCPTNTHTARLGVLNLTFHTRPMTRRGPSW